MHQRILRTPPFSRQGSSYSRVGRKEVVDWTRFHWPTQNYVRKFSPQIDTWTDLAVEICERVAENSSWFEYFTFSHCLVKRSKISNSLQLINSCYVFVGWYPYYTRNLWNGPISPPVPTSWAFALKHLSNGNTLARRLFQLVKYTIIAFF